MNNKGFTLVEMLAVIVILALVCGIATTGVIKTINTSKLKSEKIFVNKLSNLIDDYLDLYKPTQEVGNSYKINKCANSTCTEKEEVTIVQVTKTNNIHLSDLIEKKIIVKEDFINPKTKENCLSNDSSGAEIKVYRDEEYVYYYYVDLRGTNTTCNISAENGIINTFPDDISNELKQALGISE